MDVKKIVVVVEDVDAARTALQWALRNIIRHGDTVTLLHVYESTRSRNRTKARVLRLNGYKLALSFQDICNNYHNTKVEIIVTEGDQEGTKIATTVREIGASMLVVGLHDCSFLYKLEMGHSHNSIASIFNCKVFAIKQPRVSSVRPMIPAESVLDSSTNMDFSQIDVSRLQVPPTPPPKIPYRICPNPSAIIWRSSKSRGK
ncbi:hypothetical protein VNO78_02698 [Psophocarpus tetragonolobus]|uniref:UspA domain-containing protein n=1 Tax=Psophocarpus tetragonolobus TaxID=3891 RepID=A0AAN9T0S2_PSOTE